MINDYSWLGSINFGTREFFSTGSFNDVIVLVNGVNQIGDSSLPAWLSRFIPSSDSAR